jgi:tagatose-6-phosphate ketose/aldose isomerase
VPSTDLLIDPTLLLNVEAVVSLARSGDSPESVAVVQQAQKLFPAVRHLAITCNREGRLANLAGVQPLVLDPRTNDRSLVMTSSFTNLVLAGLCLYHRERLESEIAAICSRVSGQLETLAATAEKLAVQPTNRVVCLASSPLFPLAQEAALKILEMTAGQVVPIAETFLGLRHGPMSFLRKDALVIGFLSSDPTRRLYEMDLIRELQRKGFARIALLGEGGHGGGYEAVPANAPNLPDTMRVPFEAPFAQLLALAFSLRCGLDPDQPSPGGVISRVVGEFRIHSSDYIA